MLRHQKYNRNFKHNLLLAILFSLVAGIVNVTGLIIFNVFTTNLTGHVGEFAISVSSADWSVLQKVSFWIISFFTGAFFASFSTHLLDKVYPRYSYVVPVMIEIVCLLIVISPGTVLVSANDRFRIICLFFSMGLQNGIVSVVSGNVVRTTHLTGMVTDFGIGISELLINKEDRKKNWEKVILSGTIIFSFLLGGVLSAYYTSSFALNTIFIPIGILLFIISFDFFRTSYSLHKKNSF